MTTPGKEAEELRRRCASLGSRLKSSRDLFAKAMAEIHQAAGIEQDGLVGILAWIGDAKEAEERGARQERARIVACLCDLAVDVRVEFLDGPDAIGLAASFFESGEHLKEAE